MNKSYSELLKLQSWQERLDYLYLGDNKIGDVTFGGHRWLNQSLYSSSAWKNLRRNIIVRDYGCDMGCKDYPVLNNRKIIIHHINPITIDDVINKNCKVFDPNNLITVSFETHQIIHYGNAVKKDMLQLNGDRFENDTKLW